MHVLYEGTGSTGTAQGGTQVSKISVAKNTETGIHVSFPENEVGGQGPSMRAAGWTAAVMSSLLLGVDPNKLNFTYDTSGNVDGPSAGALMTIGTLAAILGDAVNEGVAMTGTINPDGSIGPVGGIPQKIDGAAQAGLKTVVVPYGQDTVIDENTKKSVNVVQYAKAKGVTVKLVSNIFEAYKIATGQPLPRLKGTSRPTMPSSVDTRMRAEVSSWLTDSSSDTNQFNRFSSLVRTRWQSRMNLSSSLAKGANQALNQGNVSVGLERAVGAREYSLLADWDGADYQAYLNGGISSAIASLNDESSKARASLKKVFDRLGSTQPKTASDALGLMDAYSNAIVAYANVVEAEGLRDALAKNANQMTAADFQSSLFTISDDYSAAQAFVALAQTDLKIYLGQGSAPPPSQGTLVGLAELLRRASEANMAAFDSDIISPMAQKNNIRDEVARNRFTQIDSDYKNARFTVSQLGIDPGATGLTKEQQIYYTLGGALNVYALSTLLLSKYYSLDVIMDSDFHVTGFGRKEALDPMLNLAEQQSDGLLGLTTDTPLSAVYYADNAHAYRADATAPSKLVALYYFWQSSILSNVLANMTGEYGRKLQGELRSGNRNGDFLKAISFHPN